MLTILAITSLIACTEPTNSPAPANPEVTVEEVAPINGGNGENEDYRNTNRMGWQQPSLIIGLLGNNESLEDKVVADVGAGTGYFTKILAQYCSKVLALDIDQQFLDYIDSTKVSEVPAAFRDRIETRLTPPDLVALAPNEADAILFVNTFMWIGNKKGYLLDLKQKMKPGGRIVIVDFKRKRTSIGPSKRELRTPLYVVEDLLHEAGFRNIQAIDTQLSYQYIAIAEK